MDGACDEYWKVKRDNTSQRFKKLHEALEKMEKFDAQIKCKINRLKELVVRTYTLALATLGALRE
jgi:hypothetical protein